MCVIDVLHHMDGSRDLPLLRDISGRVAALHRAGWVHRDLKPGNIMYAHDRMTWVLIDFGVSARVGRPASVRGTALYAAPEVAEAFLNQRPSIHTTAALDAWSLGIIALEMMLGYPPLGALSDQQTVQPYIPLIFSSSDF